MATLRVAVKSVIARRCTPLSAADQEDLERGIFNAALHDAGTRRIHRVWENPDFTALYQITARRVISNLDKASYIQNVRLLKRLILNYFQNL
jgi:hypothetical protein